MNESESPYADVFGSLSKLSINNTCDSTMSDTLEMEPTVPTVTVAHDEEGAPGVSFYPSVCLQRYNRVRETLIHHLNETPDPSPVTLIEFGCAELRLHQHLKSLSAKVQKLIYVDKDEITLNEVNPSFTYVEFQIMRSMIY